MTAIKQLRLRGFKSFNKLTEIPFGNSFNMIIGPNGAGKCVEKNTLVQLADGSLVKIGDLVNNKLKKGFLKLDDGYIAFYEGVEVLSLNRYTLKIEPRKVGAFIKRKSPEFLLKIKTSAGKEIIATEYHPLFIWDGNNNKVRPIRADELKVKTKVATPMISNKINIVDSNGLVLYLESDIYWDEIMSIEKIKTKEKWVYDLTVDEDHNFVANNFFVHNSNITDALTFVLGKTSAKSLRAEKSANLIFHGGKKGNPSKEAQVDIIFDNSKKSFPVNEKEVKLSRIVRTSGNSIYKINDDTVTRQQVVDLLAAARVDPDGHNIILQGDIVRFAEMKPDERRLIIEEVSGISVYEDKKFKALNELDKVDKKLNDASIILTERETHLKELKKDRDQALKYKELEENIQRNKATYLSLQINEKNEKKEQFEKSLNQINSELLQLNKNIDEISNDIAKKKEEIRELNKGIEEKGEIEQKKLYKEIEDLKTELIKLNSRKDVCKNEVEKIDSRKKQLDKNLKDINLKLEELERERKRLEKQENLIKIEEKRLSEELKGIRPGISGQKELEILEKEIEKKEKEINELNNSIQKNIREKDQLEFQLSNVDIKDTLNNINKNKADFKKITVELSKSLNDDSSLSGQLNNARTNLIKNREELSKLEMRNISSQEISSLAVKKVLGLGRGIYGTVTDLGKVNSKYSVALGVAAGQKMNSVVVDDDKIAEKCIQYLKDNKLGVVTFLPLNKIRARPIDNTANSLKGSNGVVDLAINLVKFDSKFKDVFSYVFGSTLIVNNIEDARRLGVGRARMVTIDGDLMELSGAMIGGYRRKIAGFKEEGLSKDIDKIKEEIDRLIKFIDELESKKIQNEDKIYELKNKKSETEGEIIKLEKIIGVKDEKELLKKATDLEGNFKSINKELESLEKNHGKLENEIKNLKEKKQNLREKIIGSKEGSNIDKIEKELSRNKEQLIQISSDIKNIDVQINDIYSKEKDKTFKISKDHEKEKTDFENELGTLEKNIKEKATLLKDKEILEKKFYSEFKNLFAKRNKLNEEVNKNEGKAVREEERIKSVQNRINNISLDKAKIVAELEGLNKGFEEFKDVKLRRGITLDQLKYEISQFESNLKNLGNVNLRALEIYENVEKEYQIILDKVDKLRFEKDDVLKMMHEIDNKKKDLFMQTFKIIDKNFQRIFSSLSTKGNGHLEIENEEDIFNTGIDIKVKIIGNKFLDIRALSGGEKTMTALAFIFSIQEYDPAPFYLLDEVDAALDKTNSELLSKLIQKYASNAQYIVISHNDDIISEAEYIYGVSMQNEVSKVVSLKI